MAKKPLPSDLLRLLTDMPVVPGETAPTADEGIRLIRAFLQISDPEARLSLIEMAEKLAHGAC